MRKTSIVMTGVASLGLLLSFAAHAVTFFGIVPGGVWVLHLGIFVFGIPALIYSLNSRGRDAWRDLLRVGPRWMKVSVLVLFVYAFFNFFSMIYLNEGGVPAEIDGKLVLHSHGKVIRELTPEEYRRHRAYSERGFSGHCVFFYGLYAAVLYYGGTGAGPRGSAGKDGESHDSR